jgi:hypothetical protein
MTNFVEVVVKATGRREIVPADWLDSPVLGQGISLAPQDDSPVEVPAAPAPPSEVQLVAGDVDDLPIIPAARDAVLAARAEAAKTPPPTEDSTHDQIDTFAKNASVDLGSAKTKAEKVAVINAHLNPGGTEPTDETPATGDEEN